MNFLAFMLKQNKMLVFWVVLVGLISGGVNAKLIATISQNVSLAGTGETGSGTLFLLLALAVLTTGILTETLMVHLSTKLTLSLRLNICSQILEIPLRSFEKVGVSRYISTFTEDVNSLNGALLRVPTFFINFSIILGCLIYLATLSFTVLLVLFAFLLFSAGSYVVPEKTGMHLILKSREAWDTMMSHFTGMTRGMKELKLHFSRRESFYSQALSSSIEEVRRTIFKHRLVYLILRNWSQFLYFGFMGLLLFVLPRYEDLGLAAISAFTIIGLYIYGPLTYLVDSVPIFRRAGISYRKIQENGLKISTRTFAPYAHGEAMRKEIQNQPQLMTLDFEDITHVFYREQEERHFTMGPMNLSFYAGELIFIVGGNGSGKTTLAKLIAGLYQPENGRVLFNGIPVDDDNVEFYRQYFTAIFSDFYVFEQILGIDTDKLDDRALYYLKLLQLDHKVSITDGNLSNVNLSTGQRKRLALLTAYLEDRPIYIFDEWAADQDPEFKDVFYRKLLPDLKDRGKTIFVISHDDRYFDAADRLIKLADGQIESDTNFTTDASHFNFAMVDTFFSSSRPDMGQHQGLSGELVNIEALKQEHAPPKGDGKAMKRTLKGLAYTAAAVLLLGLISFFYLRGRVMGSLPQLEGEQALPGLAQTVRIERDDLGIPTIYGENRLDLIRATGFLHAQDRYFQMDLLRRRAAGELAALLGGPGVRPDRQARIHRFRTHAKRIYENASPQDVAIMDAYAEGVNHGLQTLGDKPPEYLLLRTHPEPWLPEDAVLVTLSMYLNLQDHQAEYETTLSLMYDVLPEPLADFLAPAGTYLDAPLEGGLLQPPPIPGPEVFDMRKAVRGAFLDRSPNGLPEPQVSPGSNVWALSADRTADGRALLANDMHLALTLPNTWYRMSLVWSDETGAQRRLTGIALPGTPLVTVGSNGDVAWGFAAGNLDATDLIIIQPDPANLDQYLTPDGSRPYETFEETIDIRGGDPITQEVVWTKWGPVVGQDRQGRNLVLRWVAHDEGAVNFHMIDLDDAATIEEAFDIANRSGAPTQNFVAADRAGAVGWTILGLLPNRSGFEGRLPRSWHDGAYLWDGWVAPENYPRVINPADGQIWAANNRVVGGDMLATLGNPTYQLGARAAQIRDSLAELNGADTQDMLDLQMDDRALLMERWRDLILSVLTPEAAAGDEHRETFRRLITENWDGKAAVDSAGYRMVRTYRLELADKIFFALTQACRAVDEDFFYYEVNQHEGPLWRLLTERPAHLLPPEADTWDQLLLDTIDSTITYFLARTPDLEGRTWGERNIFQLRHPMGGVPVVGRWLNLDPHPIAGDVYLPRVQNRNFGAAMRFAVSPGNEAQGYFHMPGGQSGHPFSPYYDAGHQAWRDGEPTPFLPGETKHTLVLNPE